MNIRYAKGGPISCLVSDGWGGCLTMIAFIMEFRRQYRGRDEDKYYFRCSDPVFSLIRHFFGFLSPIHLKDGEVLEGDYYDFTPDLFDQNGDIYKNFKVT